MYKFSGLEIIFTFLSVSNDISSNVTIGVLYDFKVSVSKWFIKSLLILLSKLFGAKTPSVSSVKFSRIKSVSFSFENDNLKSFSNYPDKNHCYREHTLPKHSLIVSYLQYKQREGEIRGATHSDGVAADL